MALPKFKVFHLLHAKASNAGLHLNCLDDKLGNCHSFSTLIVCWGEKVFFFFSVLLLIYCCRDSRNVWSNLFPKYDILKNKKVKKLNLVCNSDQTVLSRHAESRFQVRVISWYIECQI